MRPATPRCGSSRTGQGRSTRYANAWRAGSRRRSPSEVVAALRSQGLLDDARFSTQWAESREARNPRSARLIARELLAKGVDGALADEAVREIDDEESAYRACLKYSRIGGRADPVAFQRRLLGYLRRRGFSQSVSRRAIGRLMDERANETWHLRTPPHLP